eukprot:3098880-Rhodomonas_salina.3
MLTWCILVPAYFKHWARHHLCPFISSHGCGFGSDREHDDWLGGGAVSRSQHSAAGNLGVGDR